MNPGAEGKAGGVSITTKSLEVLNGAELSASTEGVGDAGSVTINATDSVKFDGEDKDGFPSAALSEVKPGAVGNAGGVTITTGSLSLTNGGEVSANTFGEGNAGDITVNARESITITGVTENTASGIFANAFISTGNGGNINVFADDEITIDDGGTIEASNFDSFGEFNPGTGEPGNITIKAKSLSLTNEAIIQASTQSQTGNRANINLQLTEDLELRNNSLISARAFEEADGGNLIIDARFIVAFPSQFDGNDILARAEQGMGGNINIFTQGIFGITFQERPTPQNDITASSEFGLSGNVTINTLEADPTKGLVELPKNLVDPSEQIDKACTPGSPQRQSSFVVTGRGGLPLSPTEPLQDTSSLTQWVKPRTSPPNPAQVEIEPPAQYPDIKPIKTSMGDIYPARGIIKTEDGQIILTVYPTDNINTRTPQISPNCS